MDLLVVDLEGLLVNVGAVKSNDSRLLRASDDREEDNRRSIRSGKMFSANAGQSTDDDWD